MEGPIETWNITLALLLNQRPSLPILPSHADLVLYPRLFAYQGSGGHGLKTWVSGTET